MPLLACWSCGRNIYATSPLDSLFADERRCPRCGVLMDLERRAHVRAARRCAARILPTTRDRHPKASAASRSGDPANGAAVASASPRYLETGLASRARHVPRARPDRRFRRPRAARGRWLDRGRLEPVGCRTGPRPRVRGRRRRARDACPGARRRRSRRARGAADRLPRAARSARRRGARGAARVGRRDGRGEHEGAPRRTGGGQPAPLRGWAPDGRPGDAAGSRRRRPTCSSGARGSWSRAIRPTPMPSSGSRRWPVPPVRSRSGWTPPAHDAAVAVISHLPLVAAAALVETAAGAAGEPSPADWPAAAALAGVRLARRHATRARRRRDGRRDRRHQRGGARGTRALIPRPARRVAGAAGGDRTRRAPGRGRDPRPPGRPRATGSVAAG